MNPCSAPGSSIPPASSNSSPTSKSAFGIVVQDEEIVPENLDSVGQIAAYVEMKHAAQPMNAIAV